MKDLFSILNRPVLHEAEEDFYLPTADEAAEAARLFREEVDLHRDHLEREEFDAYLLQLAREMETEGRLTPEERADIEEMLIDDDDPDDDDPDEDLEDDYF